MDWERRAQAIAAAKPSKTLDENFRDWEGEAFGFGYGSGEEHILPALQAFMRAVLPTGGYDHEDLAIACGSGATAWLFINILCREDAIEYGTSPRYGWLTPKGKRLQSYVLSKSPSDLIDIACVHGDIGCSKTACNCGENGYEEGRVCFNPFWHDEHNL